MDHLFTFGNLKSAVFRTLFVFTSCLLVFGSSQSTIKCKNVTIINDTIRSAYSNGRFFTTYVTNTTKNRLVDNICYTWFKDNRGPESYIGLLIESRVFTSGLQVNSTVFTQPTSAEKHFAYRCIGEFVFGTSSMDRQITQSCLEEVQAVIESKDLIQETIYPLPMKLPHECVTNPLE